MKRYVIIIIFLFCGLLATAQQDPSDRFEYAPQHGDISLSVLFGRGNFLNSGLIVPSSPQVDWTISGTAPYGDMFSGNENSVSNIVGVEGRFFLSNRFAIKLSGGAIIRDTPSRLNIQSFTDFRDGNNQTWIPHYAAVEGANQVDVNVTLGGEYHFSTRYARVSPYTGISLPFYFARRSVYDPSLTANTTGEIQISDIGTRHVEIIGTGAQLVGGVDYYLLEGMYVGVEIKPISYVYAYSKKRPGPGFDNLEADSHTFSLLTQTFLKLGFRF